MSKEELKELMKATKKFHGLNITGMKKRDMERVLSGMGFINEEFIDPKSYIARFLKNKYGGVLMDDPNYQRQLYVLSKGKVGKNYPLYR